LQTAESAKSQELNCATISLKYVCGKLGVIPSWEDLSQIVHGSDKKTSLFEMKGFVDRFGLNSLAAKTDLATLKALGNHQAILHLPMENHYVVLGNIGDDYVRLIDLENNNFYYRHSIEHFESTWDNTALIVSNMPVTDKGRFERLDDSQLNDIVGAANCQDCNVKIQDANDHPCTPSTSPCDGISEKFFERWGCDSSTTSTDSCIETQMIGSLKELCLADPNENCVGGGRPRALSISACK
jgi:hypothetical protein